MEAAVFFYLALQPLKYIADELHNLPATQARHVDVVTVHFALVVVTFAVDVHQVKFVNQSVALQQLQGPVDGAAVDTGIELLRPAEKLGRIQVLRGGLHHAQDGAALLGHADTASSEMSLQAARHLCFWEWHKSDSSTVATGRNRAATNSCAESGQAPSGSGMLVKITLSCDSVATTRPHLRR